MPSAAAASPASSPLAGVRVHLHLRSSTGAPHEGDGVASVRAMLRAARGHAQQLGATLTVSDADADLIIFHGGGASFLAAAHAKFKAVVRPDYLAACVAAGQRVDITAYVVTPSATAAVVEGAAAAAATGDTHGSGAGSARRGSKPARHSTAVSSPPPLQRFLLLDEEDEADGVHGTRLDCPRQLTTRSSLADAEAVVTGHVNRGGVVAPRTFLDDARTHAVGAADAARGSGTCAGDHDADGGTLLCGVAAVVVTSDPAVSQPSADTVLTTPHLSPPPTHGAESRGGPPALAVRAVEEEAIRHAVLRTTATAAMTRRRGRRVSSSPVSMRRRTEAGGHTAAAATTTAAVVVVDPFLHRASGTPTPPPGTHTTLSRCLEELSGGEAALTQPLVPALADTASAAPPQQTATRPRLRQTADRDGGGAVSVTAPTRRRRLQKRVAPRMPPETHWSSADDEPPLQLSFTDTSLLRPLVVTDDGGAAAAAVLAGLCVHLLVEDLVSAEVVGNGNSGGGGGGEASASASLVSFLRDVVVQLGAACVVVGEDGASEDGASWFALRTGARVRDVARAAPVRRPTHAVVGLHSVVTPDLLYYKALGIPIVTPQWLVDAVSLGTLPAIHPQHHVHPIFGDTPLAVTRTAAASITADVDMSARRGLLGADDEDDDHEEVPRRGPRECRAVGGAAAAAAGAAASAARRPSGDGGSAVLRQLRKEVAEEYVSAAEQATRPFFEPIFQDSRFYLYVPPIDLADVAARSRNGAAPRCSGALLLDAAAALAQATALLRLLGGTVTRTTESASLDLIIDLTGFYADMAVAGAATRDELRVATLRESLSCAFHDALQRVARLPTAVGATAGCGRGGDAATTPPPPPVVGIAWLVHSILTRQWTPTAPFVLEAHPLASRVAEAGPRCPHTHSDGVVTTATLPVSAAAPTMAEAPLEPRSASLAWSAVAVAAAAPHLKPRRGPCSAVKDAAHQPSTQDIAALLGGATTTTAVDKVDHS